ncbi:MAG: GDSL-type esterase/lipase family protein [Micrococcaceae bacterium]
MAEKQNMRIVAVGDDLLAGVGDTRALGWLGRVLARTPRKDPQINVYPLAMPNEGTAKLVDRWEKEAAPRFEERTDNRLIIALGHADIKQGLSLARSRLNLANILDQAQSRNVTTMVVGPPPTVDATMNKKIAEFSRVLGDVAARRNVLYVDMYNPLVSHDQWRTDLADGQGFPGQAGYGLMAWLVLHRGWYPWLGLSEPKQ